MYFHTVLLKLKPGTDQEVINTMLGQLNGLASRIDEVAFLKAMVNESPTHGGYLALLFSGFNDKSAYESYMNHKLHKEVVDKYVLPILEDHIFADGQVNETLDGDSL